MKPHIKSVHGVLPPGLKRPGREVGHSPPSSVEVKNEWRYTSVFSIYLHGVDGVILRV